MVTDITIARWNEAQRAERSFHNGESFQEGFNHYMDSYGQYFNLLSIHWNQGSKKICEIGPADYPALVYCHKKGIGSFIIEPMPSETLKRFNIPIRQEPAETCEYNVDEVWLFNVLQHVINPYKIVERAKKQSKVIRYFEPINYGVNECHPWNLTKEMFEEWFPGSVKIWEPNQPVKNFHTWECAYGVYKTGL